MISHFDKSENPDSDFKEICEEFDGQCESIICYSSPKNDPHHLADLMFDCASRMSPVKLDIKNEEFFLNFNIQEFAIKTKNAFQTSFLSQ